MSSNPAVFRRLRLAGLAAFAFALSLAGAGPAFAQSPQVFDVQPSSAPTLGGVRLTITGSNFGPGPGTVEIQGRLVGVFGPDWSPNRITLDLPEGDPGPTILFVRTQAGETSHPWFNFSYLPPYLSSLAPGSGPAAGGTTITIHGENFGTSEVTQQARMGGKIALCQRISHQELRVTTPTLPPGQAVDWRVEVNGLISNATTFAVEPPLVAAVSPPQGPTQGGVLVTLQGSNFGANGEDPQPIVRFNGIAATSVARLSQEQVECLLPAGSGASRPVSVEVGGAIGPATPAFGYLPPLIASVDPPAGPAYGSVRITLQGENFGPPGTPRQLKLAPLQGGLETSLAVVEPETDHFRVVADVPPIDPGDYQARVLIDDQWSNAGAYTANGQPTIASLSSSNGPTQGGVPLTILGENFGAASGIVRLGPWTCPIDFWSNTLIECRTPPGYGGMFPVIVESPPGPPSNAPLYGYDPPHLLEVDPNYMSPNGGAVITLRGENFGLPGAPLEVRMGGQPAPVIEWRNHFEVVVSSPPGTPGTVAPACVRMNGGVEHCRDIQFGNPVAVELPRLPSAFGLRLAGANPSPGATALAIDLPRDARYRLHLFDSSGRLVRRFEADAAAGTQVVRWDGADARGGRTPSGLYWARLEVAGERFVRRVMRL